MSNGEVCCILGVCCPPGSSEQREALIREVKKQRPKMTEADVEVAADRILAAHGFFADVPVILSTQLPV